jgi:hypothetical protein
MLSLSGCILPDYLRLSYYQNAPATNDRVVFASLEVVAQATELGLRGLGMRVSTNPEGQDLRLVAADAHGNELVAVLSRVRDGQTRVHIEAGSGDQVRILISILSRFQAENG